ncbi:MAG: PAS domain-containing protein [Deltaproteobacteria bacterium]|nr:PAS domain-containing protein [Deltaproteobacteria bacterium]
MGEDGKPTDLSANLIDIVEHSPLAIAVFDREMRYVLHSARYLTEYGTALLGQACDRPGADHEVFMAPQRYRDVHQRCLAGASESAEAEPFARLDGRVEWTNWATEAAPWRTGRSREA